MMSLARVFHWDEVLVLKKLFAVGDASPQGVYIYFLIIQGLTS
tara:strand:+ start:504 stop:632 length:129 start_codon:yes stop_codon:yes gene_type:complete